MAHFTFREAKPSHLSYPDLDDRLQSEGQSIQVLRLHIGAQNARGVLEILLKPKGDRSRAQSDSRLELGFRPSKKPLETAKRHHWCFTRKQMS